MKRKILIQRLNSIKSSYRKEHYLSIFFSGQPGLGKTTMAAEFAEGLNKKLVVANGGELKSSKDLTSIIVNLKSEEVLFIDEMHLASKFSLAPLFGVLEERKIHSTYKLVNTTKVISININPVIIICATTDLQKIEIALIDRFDFHFHFTSLDLEEMSLFCDGICKEVSLSLEKHQKADILKIANVNLLTLKKVINQLKKFGASKSDSIYELLDLDNNGLNSLELLYVKVLSKNTYSLDMISRIMKMSSEFVKNVIEPSLLNYGIIEVSSRGRKLSLKGIKLYAS